MTKDAYYFPHDSNAKDDPKIMMLIDQLNLEGYGIFWVLIETLRDQKDYRCPIALVPVIAKRYNTTPEKIRQVICNYSLFIIEDNQFFFSKSLINRLDNMNERKQRRIQASIKANEARWGKLSERSANGQLKLSERNANGDTIESESIPLDYTILNNTKLNETKLDKTINENCASIIESIMSYFSFSEVANFDKFRTIHQFVTLLNTTNRLDIFKTQFEAYRLYKDRTSQLKHGFKSFIGSIENHFEDGGWNAENWVEKLRSVNNEPDQQQAYSAVDVARRAADKLKSELS